MKTPLEQKIDELSRSLDWLALALASGQFDRVQDWAFSRYPQATVIQKAATLGELHEQAIQIASRDCRLG